MSSERSRRLRRSRSRSNSFDLQISFRTGPHLVSMKWQNGEYDVIILGSGLAGLIAGVCLAKGSRRVVLLKEKAYHPCMLWEGYRFAPFSNFSEKRLNASLLARLSKELNFPPGEPSSGPPKSPKREVAFQVILPKARIDLFSNPSDLRKEWKREFPKELDPIEGFYNEVEKGKNLLKKEKMEEGFFGFFPVRPPSLIKRLLPFGSFRERTNKERLSDLSKDFGSFIRLQLLSLGNLHPDRFPISLVDYLLQKDDGLEEGTREVDLETLRDKILERFVHWGGLVEEIEGVERMEWKWRSGVMVSSRGDGNAFRSRALLLNSPLHRVSRFLGKKGRLLRRWEERIKPRYGLMALFLGIREKVVPVGMGNLLVSVSDPDKPLEGGNLLFISLSTEAPEGRVALTAESLVSLEGWDEDSLAEHRRGVMAHLFHLMPFLEANIEFSDFAWTIDQFSCWSNSHFIYETNHDFHWREGVVPTRFSKNLYFAGKENFPYLGVEGEVLSGWMVFRQIMERLS